MLIRQTGQRPQGPVRSPKSHELLDFESWDQAATTPELILEALPSLLGVSAKFVGAEAAKYVRQSVVAFVAGVFVNRAGGPLHRQFALPGPVESGIIHADWADGEAVSSGPSRCLVAGFTSLRSIASSYHTPAAGLKAA